MLFFGKFRGFRKKLAKINTVTYNKEMPPIESRTQSHGEILYMGNSSLKAVDVDSWDIHGPVLVIPFVNEQRFNGLIQRHAQGLEVHSGEVCWACG